MDGFLLIDKPQGPTSFGAIAQIRRIFGEKKVGHAGTLDPMATGLLVIALGSSTRLLPYLPLQPKRYLFKIKFGMTTDTLDTEGEVIESGKPIPQEQDIKQVLAQFTGKIEQVPPSYSAIKINGQRAYSLARKGETPDMVARSITIDKLDIREFNKESSEAECEVVCSAGTYVRSLARDIAISLNTCGYATKIRRTGIGIFDISKAVSLDKITKNNSGIIQPFEALQSLFSITANPEQQKRLARGQDLLIQMNEYPQTVCIYDTDKKLLAVCEFKGEMIYHPVKVFVI